MNVSQEGGMFAAKLWHNRLGHISLKGMEILGKQNLLLGDVIEEMPVCDHCMMGKAQRVKFNVGEHNSKGILDYVHTDLWGPARTASKGGARYFLSIIDDYSRRVWTYSLKSKDQAFDKFKEWQYTIENQVGRRVKVLRSDNGMEFYSSISNQHCLDEGIKRHKSVPYSPQQNGVAERMNRTLLDRVRCMLASA